jgi:hypothetical protein
MIKNDKMHITKTSKLLLFISKFFFPDVEKINLPNGNYVSNEEMYVLAQDRTDTNPYVFHHTNVGQQDTHKRNIMVSLIRRQLWQRGNLIGAVIFIAGTVIFGTINFGIVKTKDGFDYVSNKIEENKSNEKNKQETIDSIKAQVIELKQNCSTGKTPSDECTSRMNDLKQEFEKTKNQ